MDSLSVMTAANVIIESMIVNYDQIFSPEEVKQFRVSLTLTPVKSRSISCNLAGSIARP